MSSLNNLSSWKEIGNHSNKITEKSLNEIFMEDKDRFNKFSILENDLLLDFSKNHIDDKMMELFSRLLVDIDLKGKIHDLFNGEKINTSENRSVLHFLLRGTYTSKTKELYENDVKKGLKKLKLFSKNHIDDKMMELFSRLLVDIDLKGRINDFFNLISIPKNQFLLFHQNLLVLLRH